MTPQEFVTWLDSKVKKNIKNHIENYDGMFDSEETFSYLCGCCSHDSDFLIAIIKKLKEVK